MQSEILQKKSKKHYFYLAINHFTKFVWVYIVWCSRTQNAKKFVNLIKTLPTNLKPKKILANRYAGIKSKEFITFLEKKIPIDPY